MELLFVRFNYYYQISIILGQLEILLSFTRAHTMEVGKIVPYSKADLLPYCQ